MTDVITIYDEQGRTKLPARVLRKLGLGKNSKLLVKVSGDSIILTPLRVKWPKKGKIDEDKVLEEKHLAWYEVP